VRSASRPRNDRGASAAHRHGEPNAQRRVQVVGRASRWRPWRPIKVARGELRGPLHGVPMTIKDSLDTAGSFRPADQGAGHPGARAGRHGGGRLRAVGAILLAKTNTPELTLSGETDNLVYGRTNNPYDVARTPAGAVAGPGRLFTSGGSAFDMAVTLARIRLPAHFCGIAASSQPLDGAQNRHIVRRHGRGGCADAAWPHGAYVEISSHATDHRCASTGVTRPSYQCHS